MCTPRLSWRPASFTNSFILLLQSRAVIGTTSGWRDSERMVAAVESGEIDMCGLGRPLRDDPSLPKRLFGGEKVVSKL